MKYLVVGSGGREHTLAWRLMTDGSADEVYVAPGNGGTAKDFRLDIAVTDHTAVEAACIDKKIDIVIVGPEVPLVGGMVDYLEDKKIPVFGPSQKAARLEGSKIFAKSIMEKCGVSTALHEEFRSRKALLEYIDTIESYPVVIKLDGLAAGKGVGIPESRNEAIEFIEQNVKNDSRVFVEEYLRGEEASVLCVSDGETIAPFVAAQDHKRIFNGDEGPNTGGMGAYAPAPVMNKERFGRACNEVLQPVVDCMKKEGTPFKGILYAGLMVDGENIKVLEFNVRFGDPEAQVILPLMNEKLGDIIQGTLNGNLKECSLTCKDATCITVVLSAGGYPGKYENGKLISGLDDISDEILVFHAGTKEEGGKYYTNGGRVLNVTALGDNFKQAREKVYSEIDKITFDGVHYRTDIGHWAMKYFDV